MGGHWDMGIRTVEVSSKKDQELIIRLYAALKRITCYQSPERLQRSSQKEWGLDYQEALEGAYENVIQEAKDGIKGVRLPKVAKPSEKPAA